MCRLVYMYIPVHRIPSSDARLVDSPSSCLSPALSPSLLPPPPNFYKYIILPVHARIHAHTHSSTCTQTLRLLYMYLSFPNLNNEQTHPHSGSITSSQLLDLQRSTQPSFSTIKVKLFTTCTAQYRAFKLHFLQQR